jgi:RHS repeat-associated protein
LPELPTVAPGEVLIFVVAIAAGPFWLTESAFGELLSHTGSDPQPYAFTGEPLDLNSGFQYHRARWMDPRVGAFTGIDPFLGFEDDPRTLARYSYSHADPVNFLDPSGQAEFTIAGITISIQINSIIRSQSTVTQVSAGNAVRARAASLNIRAVRHVVRQSNQHIHHLIEQRLWQRSPALQRIFKHPNDIPGISVSPTQHQYFTNLWLQAFPRSNQVGYIAQPSLEAILAAAEQIYGTHSLLFKAILVALI